jgi:nicotinamidase-related amidase
LPALDGYTTDPQKYLNTAANVIGKARAAGAKIIYITVGFRPGFPEVSDNNTMFAGVRTAGWFVRGQLQTDIPAQIAPSATDVVIEKHRVSSFEGTDLALVLRSAKIQTLVLFGIATSGVVLSTTRQASDLDYRLLILRDLCADKDDEVHRVLMEKILPTQASILSSDEFLAQLGAGSGK